AAIGAEMFGFLTWPLPWPACCSWAPEPVTASWERRENPSFDKVVETALETGRPL
ncbi:hypothetical protein BDY21DRAFT_332477, partial [Lineolata rhizophorae]